MFSKILNFYLKALILSLTTNTASGFLLKERLTSFSKKASVKYTNLKDQSLSLVLSSKNVIL